jgi:anti-sigma factor RsiW
MNSRHLETETISAYLDGEVTSRERAQVEQHLASCPSCGAISQRMKTASRSVAALGPVEMTADEHRALRQTLLGAGRGRAASRWSFGRLQWSLAGAFAVLAVAVVGFAFMRSIPTDDGGQQSVTEAMAPADESGSQITIDSDDQIPGKVLALPEVKDSISRAGAAGRSVKAAPEAPAALPRTDAASDSSAAQSNESAETFANGRDGGGAGAAGGSGAYAGATTGGEGDSFSEGAGDRCSAALDASQPDPLEPIAAREISYQGKPAWLVVYAAPAGSGNGIEEIRAFVVDPGDCANLSGKALESAILSRSAFKP